MLCRDKAICLRKVDYSETSQIVTMFSRLHGRFGAIAKGSKRPRSNFGGAIEILSLGDIVFSAGSSGRLSTITEFERQAMSARLRSNLFVMNCAYFAVELLEHFLAEADPHPELFDAAIEFLEKLSSTNEDRIAKAMLVKFQAALLEHIGTMPILNACANCSDGSTGRWPEVYFSSSANGLLCPACEQAFVEKVKLSTKCAAGLANIEKIEQADKATIDKVERIFIHHFTELMHRPPKMARLLK